MNVPIVNNLNNKNDTFYNLPHKVYHQEYYIEPQSKPKGHQATFQGALKLTIVIGQCFGLLPVVGVCDVDTSKLRLKFFSGRFLYSILSIVGQSGMFLLGILKLITNTDGSLSHNTYLVFFGSNTFITILYLKMATKWPRLCQQISKTEAADPNMDASLIKRCNISCIVVLSLAIVEHLLSDLSGIAVAMDCQPEKNIFDAFYLQCFSWIWNFIPFNRFYSVICKFFTVQLTFNWNFADAFVICISWYLTSRLEQINKRIKTVKGKCDIPSSFWRTMREDYSQAINLVKRVDDVINGVMLISFANNLFSICLQLLHILEDGIKRTPVCNREPDERLLKGYGQIVYLVYSFSFLVSRSLAVSLIAARVHTASLAPAQELYEVPSSAYCVEVQRFLSQIHGDSVSLSGLQLFSVKRGIVLTIAGIIVTYELVLMQFAGVSTTVAPSIGPVIFLPIESTTQS